MYIIILLLFWVVSISASDTLLILTGQLRAFNFIKHSFEKHILEVLEPDIVFCVSPLQTLIEGKTPNLNYEETLQALESWPNKVILKTIIPRFNSSTTDKIKDNIMQQMYVWQTCWDEIINLNVSYKYYIKHRFDEALYDNYPSKTEIINTITPNSILLASYLDFCDGVNDRLWIGDRDGVETAFNTLDYYLQKQSSNNCPEFYLYKNLEQHKTKIYRKEFYVNVMDTNTGCPRHICLGCNIYNNQYQLLIKRGYNPFIYNITSCI